MAIKDWKPNKKYKNHFINKDTKEEIAMVFDYIGYEGKWLVSITYDNGDLIKEQVSKTKTKALKFAKAYMRKH